MNRRLVALLAMPLLAAIFPTITCISNTTHGESAAPRGFTASSGVTEWSSGDLEVGVEAVIPAGGLSVYRFPFDVPLGKRILRFDGDIAFRSGCYAQALTSIQFEGAGEYVIIQKLPEGGGVANQEFKRSVPIITQSTKGIIKVEADPVSPCAGTTTVELQGILEIEK